MSINFIDNSEEVLSALHEAAERALEKCGLTAEGYAKKATPVDTGNLRNSISRKVQKDTMFVGTNVEYAPYVEFGTGKYYPGGRPDPWVYKDEKGNWHRTSGVKAKPFIKPSVADHKQQYFDIIEQELKK
jgi:HK97 gp10 family phage protein